MKEGDKEILRFVRNSQDGIADSHLIESKLGISARNRCVWLTAQEYLALSVHKGYPTYSIIRKGERELLPFWKRVPLNVIEAHGWELFKWVASFASLAGTYAIAEKLLSKFT